MEIGADKFISLFKVAITSASLFNQERYGDSVTAFHTKKPFSVSGKVE